MRNIGRYESNHQDGFFMCSARYMGLEMDHPSSPILQCQEIQHLRGLGHAADQRYPAELLATDRDQDQKKRAMNRGCSPAENH